VSDPAGATTAAREVPASRDFDHAPLLMKLIFTAAGLALMSLAAGLIPSDPARFLAPHWVVFVVGLAFFLGGILMFIGKHRLLHPALYMFPAAVMSSALAAVFSWVAIWSTGPFKGGLAIGPVAISTGDSSDIVPRVLFGVIAALTCFIAALAWYRWWRALRGLPVDLGS